MKRPDRPLRRFAPLARDEITVWWLSTDAAGRADIERWSATLDEDERARAARFHFDADRRDFIAAHALLRAMLTSCLGASPDAWRFSIDANGKPGIDNRLAVGDVAFNLSHTRGLVAVALASHGAIGVDVEKIDDAKADLAVAEAYFAPAEVELMRRAPAAHRTLAPTVVDAEGSLSKAIGGGPRAARFPSRSPWSRFALTWAPARRGAVALRDPADDRQRPLGRGGSAVERDGRASRPRPAG